MQADIWFMQSTFSVCPICNAPLPQRLGGDRTYTRQRAPERGNGKRPNAGIQCAACGFTGPHVARQHAEPSSHHPTRQTSNSSVWIDPAVSAYLAGGRGRNAAPAQPKKQANPTAPIPPRTSAQPSVNGKVRPKEVEGWKEAGRKEMEGWKEAGWKEAGRKEAGRKEAGRKEAGWRQAPPLLTTAFAGPVEPDPDPALSLIVDVPTQPETPLFPGTGAPQGHINSIEEIDTVPPVVESSALTGVGTHANPVGSITEIDTVAPRNHQSGEQNRPGAASLLLGSGSVPTVEPSNHPMIDETPRLVGAPLAGALSPRQSPRERLDAPLIESPFSVIGEGASLQATMAPPVVQSEPTSWTAGGAAESQYAQLIAYRGKKRKRQFALNPLDRLRWWLIRPGRIEFLFWLGGTLLLMAVTCVLLLVTAFSFALVSPGVQTNTVSSATDPGIAQSPLPTVVTYPGLTLTLIDKGPLIPGQPFHVGGQGFSPYGRIEFIDEHEQRLLIQNDQSHTAHADAHGAFLSQLMSSTWRAGQHLLVARDLATNHQAALVVTLTPAPFGKNVPVSPTSLPGTPPPGVTATPTSGNGSGPVPTAVGQPPVPITPTIPTKPTPTRVPPTPTSGVTPAPTSTIPPTAGVTPPSNTGTAATPTAISTTTSTSTTGAEPPTGTSNMGNVGMQFLAPMDLSFYLRSWLWLLIAGYGLAMLLLGIAGMLHKKR